MTEREPCRENIGLVWSTAWISDSVLTRRMYLHLSKVDSFFYLDGSVFRAVRANLSDAVLKPVKLWFVPGVRAVCAQGYRCDYVMWCKIWPHIIQIQEVLAWPRLSPHIHTNYIAGYDTSGQIDWNMSAQISSAVIKCQCVNEHVAADEAAVKLFHISERSLVKAKQISLCIIKAVQLYQ